jgi:hypothetical protein
VAAALDSGALTRSPIRPTLAFDEPKGKGKTPTARGGAGERKERNYGPWQHLKAGFCDIGLVGLRLVFLQTLVDIEAVDMDH